MVKIMSKICGKYEGFFADHDKLPVIVTVATIDVICSFCNDVKKYDENFDLPARLMNDFDSDGRIIEDN